MLRLILIPTELERRLITSQFAGAINARDQIKLCGFGPIEAAATTSQHVARLTPTEVVLLGIAGSYEDRLSVGSAHEFHRIDCYGVGAGTGDDHQTAHELGWDRRGVIQLRDPEKTNGLLLTCCAAAANEQDVAHRLRHTPEAMAEDMEAYGVAVACQLANVRLRVIRGISNRAGDRNKQNWKIEEAAMATAELFLAECRS